MACFQGHDAYDWCNDLDTVTLVLGKFIIPVFVKSLQKRAKLHAQLRILRNQVRLNQINVAILSFIFLANVQ